MPHRFENVSCSQCGEDLGPGENGFSRCSDHDFILRDPAGKEVMRVSFDGVKATIELPNRRVTASPADITGLRDWLERKLGCLYDQSAPTEPPQADGERG